MRQNWESWIADVERELARLGLNVIEAKHAATDEEDWFRGEFDNAAPAELTAADWLNNN